ncbi:RNB domain-containing ribonuclease [Actinophytocola oryzae]|uniref:RNB domain-containing protein n=1 Tax=Actinophytocola oryzae TaxID=502181 RepID=A0A4R7UVE0_9PSEU|nr:RNB domain-containing ribonuclease [Actinophytocola oryzae]TDV37555.1 RNB domain-containing protein [Actinophytocola oryzae]
MVVRAKGDRIGFARVREEFALPTDFPEDVLAEADRAAGAWRDTGRDDATDLPLVTIDPPGSRDLDQAMAVERVGAGFRVHYAIADLGAFVTPGGALDREVRRRGQTIYLPDGNVPLHPGVLSEGAASLLPGQVTPAALWTLDCDSDGLLEHADVRRAFVRSQARLDYDTVQRSFADRTAHPAIQELPAIGRLRRERALERGAVELQLPDQDVEANGDGWRLVLRPRTEVDAWNAEISLLTGMAAAKLMLDAGVGILRTLPDPENGAVKWLRRSARSLGITWPRAMDAAKLLAGLDPDRPEALALFMDATRLLRGAGYTVFDGAAPRLTTHAGIAAPYAHVTAPLRRLVDRFGAEICLAVAADRPVPEWVRSALPELPTLMAGSDTLAARVDKACLDQTEAWVLAGRIGQEFDAIVLRSEGGSSDVFVTHPPVIAKCADGNLPEGETVRVRLTQADADARKVVFERVDGSEEER